MTIKCSVRNGRQPIHMSILLNSEDRITATTEVMMMKSIPTDIVTMETEVCSRVAKEGKVYIQEYNSCCHGRFQCPLYHDNTIKCCHSNCAINNGPILQREEIANSTSQLEGASVNSEIQSGCYGPTIGADVNGNPNHSCYILAKDITQRSRSRSASRSQQYNCIGAQNVLLNQSRPLELRESWPSGGSSEPRDSLIDAAQSHNSKSNPANYHHNVPQNPATCSPPAALQGLKSSTRWSSNSASSSSQLSTNQKPRSTKPRISAITSSPHTFMTSLVYAVILLLSVMSQNAPVLAQEPEWITEPSDTKIQELGTQTLYCRIRNRGNRAIAWIQYQRDGNVRNLFIDDERWAAPDR